MSQNHQQDMQTHSQSNYTYLHNHYTLICYCFPYFMREFHFITPRASPVACRGRTLCLCPGGSLLVPLPPCLTSGLSGSHSVPVPRGVSPSATPPVPMSRRQAVFVVDSEPKTSWRLLVIKQQTHSTGQCLFPKDSSGASDKTMNFRYGLIPTLWHIVWSGPTGAPRPDSRGKTAGRCLR